MDKKQEYLDFDVAKSRKSESVNCLGRAFDNDESRRTYFAAELRKKLMDPEFRKIEGFPVGTDEDIVALSDPPYYTACPNPWIADFIAEWEGQKPEQRDGHSYHREPFAADVSEGKNDPIYNAHSYHTKVPHKAIMRYILHYTNPGDIVFDGFCGTGMTGVAAELCGDSKVVASLGYRVMPDGEILQEESRENGRLTWKPFSRLGPRRTVLNDLSPAATFIAYNYNSSVDRRLFEEESKRILDEVGRKYRWMYETMHADQRTSGMINYTVWSDVFLCPDCAREVVFWDAAIDVQNGKVRDSYPCPHCTARLTKRAMDKALVSRFDHELGELVHQGKQVPVMIDYTAAGKRYQKKPDQRDLDLIAKIQNMKIPHATPTMRLIPGQETRRNEAIGITHIHHFYTDRNLFILSAFFERAPIWLKWAVTGAIQRGSKQHQIAITRIGGSKAKEGGATAGHRRGTLYVPSNQIEMNVINLISDRIHAIKKAWISIGADRPVIATSSTTTSGVQIESFDYLFFDPPFGANIAYSELNSLQEGWLRVGTNQEHEAIEDRPQKKSLTDYHFLMKQCFDSAYKSLKPGRWMTVEFSNTSAAVWNVIQAALQEVGFIVANVSSLDKKRGGLNAIVGNTAVKQDLVISAYKPNGGFEERFRKEALSEDGVWDFVRTHLGYLPVTKTQDSLLQFIPERDPRILFDQMVSFYVRKGYPVPVSSQEFQVGLAQRFVERDGMYFLVDQVAEYDRKKMTTGVPKQMSLFVSDEATAIQWLRQLIKDKPQTFSDINPQFMQQLGGWSKNEAQLDLRELLNQNFLSYDGKGPVPEQIHAYLSTNWKDLRNLPKDDPALVEKAQDRWYVPDPNKTGDLEKLRERALLKEFDEYKTVKKKLKVFRLEAVRAGFKRAWQDRDYPTIIAVAEKIPSKILEEDPKLLMWYDQAITRSGE